MLLTTIYESSIVVLALLLIAYMLKQRRYFELNFCLFACVLGLLVEVLGIRIYKLYFYSPEFKLVVGSVPVAIMLGWALVMFSMRRLANQLTTSWWSLPIVAGILSVILDLFLDPMLANAIAGVELPKLTLDSLISMNNMPEQCRFDPNQTLVGIGAGLWIWCLPADPALADEHLFGIPAANFLSWFVIVSSYVFWTKYFTNEISGDLNRLPFQVQLKTFLKILFSSLFSILVILLLFRFLFFEHGVSGLTILSLLALLGALVLLTGGLDRNSKRFEWHGLLLIILNSAVCWYAYFLGELTADNTTIQLLAMVNISALIFSFWLAINWRTLEVFPQSFLKQEKLRVAISQTDPEADHVIAECFQSHSIDEANLVLRQLTNTKSLNRTGELPDEFYQHIEHAKSLADSFDQARIERGQALFQTHVGICVSALTVGALPEAYAMKNAGRILGRTQRLTGNQAYKRVAETSQFVLRIMQQDGLTVDGLGTEAAIRVRLMHSAIRWLIAKKSTPSVEQNHQAYHENDWTGEPINQVELLYTHLCFSWVTLRAILQCKQQVSEQEANDYIYLWNCMGQLMGIDPSLLPDSVHQAKGTFEQVKAIGIGNSREGEALTAAALTVMTRMLDKKLWLAERVDRLLPRVFMAQFIDRKTRDVLGVKSLTNFEHFASAVVLGFFKIVTLLDRITENKMFDDLKSSIGLRLLQYFSDHPDEVGIDLFDIPQQLRKGTKREN